VKFEVRRLSYGIGAEIVGLDVSQQLDAAAVAALRRAWMDHQVLLFRDQKLTAEQHVRFTEYFGKVDAYPLAYLQHPENPKIFVLSTEDQESRDAARLWHSDLSWSSQPALGSILHCQKIPDIGGDTMFANMYMAYERLSAPYRRFIDPLYAVHELMSKGEDLKNRDPEKVREMKKKHPPIAHPMVRVHPETQRRALYVSEASTSSIIGLTRRESDSVLEFLYAHAVRPEFTYRHGWRRNDLLMWDNRCTLHAAVDDNDHTQPRLMYRTTLNGTPLGSLVPADTTGWDPAAVEAVRAR
jgi:taurine dioxygenase